MQGHDYSLPHVTLNLYGNYKYLKYFAWADQRAKVYFIFHKVVSVLYVLLKVLPPVCMKYTARGESRVANIVRGEDECYQYLSRDPGGSATIPNHVDGSRNLKESLLESPNHVEILDSGIITTSQI